MIVKNGGYRYPDYDPSGVEDHEVKAYTADVTHGPLEDKLESIDGSVAIVADTTAKKINLSVNFTTAPVVPVPSLTKRYYLTAAASDVSGDYLLSQTQPAAADLQPPAGSTYPIIVDSPVGEPGLVTWPEGIVLAHIVARVVNAHLDEHMLYPMSFGTSGESAAILAREPSAATYQSAPWPDQVYLTGDYQTIVVPLYVQSLGGSAGDRLRAWFRCNPQGGTITDEEFEIHLGDSYLDTLFTPSSGGATVHNDLTGRGYSPDNTTDCHPMSAITPGVVHSPCGAIITTTDGVFAMPESNTAHIQGAEPLLGIANVTAGGTAWQIGDCITVWIAQPRIIQGDGSVSTGYSPIYLPPAVFLDPTNPTVGPQARAIDENFIELTFSGTKWLHKSSSLG
jgi:hypothetical protein